MPELVIREAGPRDAELVANLILALANHEEVLDETDPNVDALQRHLDHKANPRLYCLIAEVDGIAVGFTVYYFTYYTNQTKWVLHMQDLFVRKSNRRQKVGSALVECLAQIVGASGIIAFEVSRLNVEAVAFYKSLGATEDDLFAKMYFEGHALKKLAEA